MGNDLDKRATQVGVALGNLTETVEELEVLVDNLERNLVSVLVPDNEGQMEGKDPDMKSGPKVILAGTLINCNSRLQLLVGELKSIQSRLEL